MQTGRLRERLTIQQETVTRDDSGEELKSWSTLATVWGQVTPGASSERFLASAGQRVAEVTHTARIRYRTGITPKMRIVWESTRILEILSVVDPDGRNSRTVLLCSEEQRG
ncbi:MAG TPA: phage head closure protein [Candidatus Competibacter phosphatis]|nr:phage head closure protein [Candidatus Competibacter phosphatis]